MFRLFLIHCLICCIQNNMHCINSKNKLFVVFTQSLTGLQISYICNKLGNQLEWTNLRGSVENINYINWENIV